MVQIGDWVRIQAIPTSEPSQQYQGQRAKVIEIPTYALGGSFYKVQMEGGQELLLERDALIPEPRD